MNTTSTILLILSIAFLVHASTPVELKTKIGTFSTVVDNEESSIGFLGIPYAKPMTANERWTPPKTATCFNEDAIFDCSSFAPKCNQGKALLSTKSETSEDCLYLNIWVPKNIVSNGKIKEDSNLPVMVFIHGGAFVLGSGADPYIDGNDFANNDVILVSINYRLGIMGFLALPELLEENINSENFGLLDQRLALLWVSQNIKYFGGNGDAITVFGESAGAMSCLWQLVATEENVPEDEKVLKHIQGFIIQSPADLETPKCYESYEQQKKILNTYFDCDNLEGKEFISCLRNIPADVLVDSLPGFGSARKIFFHTSSEEVYMFSPCTGNSDSVFSQPIRESIQSGNHAKDKKIIIGTTKDEGTLFMMLNFIVYSNFDTETIENFIKAGFFDHDDDDDATKIVNYYLHERSDLEDPVVLAEILNDIYFQCGVEEFAKLMSNYQDDVYRYVFTHFPSSGAQNLGVFHASELVFVFGKPIGGNLFPKSFTEEEKLLSKNMNNYWSNFAKYGNPNGKESIHNWNKYGEERNAIILDSTIEDQTNYKEEVCGFWKSIYPTGVPLLHGGAHELMHEPIHSFLLNEGVIILFRQFRKIAIGMSVIVVLFLVLFYVTCCGKSKTTKLKPE